MSPRNDRVVYPRTHTRPYDVEIHLVDCGCDICDPVEPPLPIALMAVAGIIVGTLLPFAWDARGMIGVLASMIGLRV
jgi:hypothetical protein